jgi:Kef-type K+ transport system membrane component KefB
LGLPARRLLVFYVVLAAVLAGAAAFAILRGEEESAEPAIAGTYSVTSGSSCLGSGFELVQSGRYVSMDPAAGGSASKLHWQDGVLTGTIHCRDGSSGELRATVEGTLVGVVGGITPIKATFFKEPPPPGTPPSRPPGSVDGSYALSPSSACLGSSLELHGSGAEVTATASGEPLGTLHYTGSSGGELTGTLSCRGTGRTTVSGTTNDRIINLELAPVDAEAGTGPVEKLTATKTRDLTGAITAVFIALVVVMLCARLAGGLMPRLGQPRVMGEVLAGILLGPTLLGTVAPDLERALFPSDIIPYIGVMANLGLVFYMFLIGLELDVSRLRGRISQALTVSNAGVAIPMAAGMLMALPVYKIVGPQTGFAGFALFMGISMSITAFPVLARIIVERRMMNGALGSLALASAAIDDVTAWVLVAFASSIAAGGSSASVIQTILLSVGFAALMVVLGRRLLSRVAVAYDEAGRIPAGWLTVILAGVVLSSYATESIGIGLIFGGFLVGLIMPRHALLTEDVTHRVEDFVVAVLLPLFFVFTGLRTNILALVQPDLLLLTAALCLVAIACKFGGTFLAARLSGMGGRESGVLATLMNTRGLTELIVLNLALDKGVISQALFSSLVLMALLTTFMAGPLLRLVDRRNEFGSSLEDELERTATVASPPPAGRPRRAILAVPQTDRGLPALRGLGESLCAGEPLRELIMVRLLAPSRATSVRGGLQTENRLLAEASAEFEAVRDEVEMEGVAARTAVFTSAEPDRDTVRLAEREEVDLLLLDGRRPLLGPGVPRGTVGAALREAPCDVGVLVAREGAEPVIGPDATILVPFGGAEHDWAALELAAWLAAARGARLQLLGSAGGDDGDSRDATRLLATASLLVQRFAGVAAEPRVVAPGREGVIEAAAEAALLVIGLAEDWRDEGLGETRAAILKAAPAPILLVRRGTRPGALAPEEDVTRFSWSTASIGRPAPEAI